MAGKNRQAEDRQYMVPMEITMEAARDFGIDSRDIIWFPLSTQKRGVYLVPASREVCLAYMQPIWAEVRRVVREGCCPESGCCEDCECFSQVCCGQNKPMSLSALVDEGAEPSWEGFEDDVIHSILFRELTAMLAEIKPKYGEIFPMLCDAATQQEVSDKLGIRRRTVSDDIEEIRSILRPLAEDIFG